MQQGLLLTADTFYRGLYLNLFTFVLYFRKEVLKQQGCHVVKEIIKQQCVQYGDSGDDMKFFVNRLVLLAVGNQEQTVGMILEMSGKEEKKQEGEKQEQNEGHLNAENLRLSNSSIEESKDNENIRKESPSPPISPEKVNLS